jgi:chromosome segregation ATPase
MSLGEFATFFSKYGDVIIGLALLLAATAVLPSQVRKYVLTAGLAIAFFRIAQLKMADIKLAKADRKRAELQNTLATLNANRDAAVKRKEELDTQLSEAKRRQSELAMQAEALATSGADIGAAKAALDQETQVMLERQKKLLEDTAAEDRVLALFNSADEAVQDLGRVQ